MIFKEYGDKNNKILVLIHAGGLSDWMFIKHIKALKHTFFLIVPIIDGHGDDTSEFVSISDSSNKLLAYLKENHNSRSFYIYGISLGAQIAMYMISKTPSMFSKAIIESCLLYPKRLLAKAMLPTISLTYPLVSKKWFAKLQAKSLYVPDNLFEKYFNDSKSLSKETLMNITKSNMTFDICFSNNINTKVLIAFGSKEIGLIKKSAIKISTNLPNSKMNIMDNMDHGQMLLSNPNKHIEYILKFLYE